MTYSARHESWAQFISRKRQEWEKEKEKQRLWMKDIGRKGKQSFVREAFTFMPQTTLKEKVFVIERLRHATHKGVLTHPQRLGYREYRIGYFIVGKNGRRKGKWTWGQFCPLIPVNDLRRLLDKAKKENTILA
ncbi:MAG: hypothetical protein ACRD2Y_11005 [Terriglobales bacterium]